MELLPKKAWNKALFWVLLVILIGFGAYSFISYWLPYYQYRAADSEAGSMQFKQCGADDKACMDSNLKIFNEHFAKLREIFAPMYDIRKKDDVIAALRHADGTICYEVDGPARDVSDEELSKWLRSYGPARYKEFVGYFLRVRRIYEEAHHLPTPVGAKMAALSSLKWKHVPFGNTWRTYNDAFLQLKWTEMSPTEILPQERINEVLPILLRHGEYFMDRNALRILDLANSQLSSKN
jgi:hypothetical protein